ncbi:hypothetical protein K2Z83_09740 [Oscillochloris sp. ZM17-4]|uniref:hypothetical protein n=1 Tax=Oscillochloris sp. ZM17-4 TaxID=2866714 RepID=UPI001C73D5E5|nr:hypothetical protein [Oscillochloris sp. ZM17-4]MBX0327956.1 hypothetical protein [Oscillochloris sp. ZM17-4]
MQIAQIAEYEVTYRPEGEPAISFFHVVRGREVARMSAAEVAELRELLAVTQKRIRPIGGGQLILGAGGDLSLYAASGQRACYLNPDQAQQLARLIGAG